MIDYISEQIAKLYSTFSDASVPTDPTNLTITIYFGSTIIIGPTSMEKISTGYFYYNFFIDPGYSLGVYSARYQGTMGGVQFSEAEEFRIVSQLSSEEPTVPVGAYCSIADVKNQLKGVDLETITGIDDIIANRLMRAKEKIDRYCLQNFNPTTVNFFVKGWSDPKIILPFRGISKIENAVLMCDLQTEYTFEKIRYLNSIFHNKEIVSPSIDLTLSDLIVHSSEGMIQIQDEFMIESPFTFRADITYGFPAANGYPQDLIDANVLLAAKEILSIKANEAGGASSRSLGAHKVSWDGYPYNKLMGEYKQQAFDILKNYKIYLI